MNKEEKILACYGHVNTKSISRMVGCELQYVYFVLRNNNLKPVRTYSPRSSPY